MSSAAVASARVAGNDAGMIDASSSRATASEARDAAPAEEASTKDARRDAGEDAPQGEEDVWRAAAYGNLEALKRMIAEDPGAVNAPDGAGYRPLQWAALNNRVAAATYLLDQGAAIGAGDNDGQTALHWACVRGSLPCAELLLRKGADLNATDARGYVPLHVAAQYGHTGMIYHFKMRWNTNIDLTDHDGRTALHWASYKGFNDPVKLLICMEADVHRADKEGCTPLHWASIKGKSEAAHTLIQAGGINALTAVDCDGSSPAALAEQKGHHSLSHFLSRKYKTLMKRDSFMEQKGLAVACLGVIVGLMLLFTMNVMFCSSAATMDVNVAFWSLFTIACASVGIYYMKRVSYSDPGFVTEALLRGIRRGVKPEVSTRASRAAVNTAADAEVEERLNHSELWAGNWHALCVSCKLVKPFGTKHCSMTDKCVARFDHYCPWMGNAIGKRNHRDFVIFLILETVAMTVAFAVAVTRYNEENPTERDSTRLGVVIFAVLDLFTLFPVAMLCISQLSQVASNITINELSNAHRYAYLQASDGGFANPFDKGVVANLRQFFTAAANAPLIDAIAEPLLASSAAAPIASAV